MNIAFGPLDYAVVAVMLGLLPLDAWMSKRILARLAGGSPGLRVKFYLGIVAVQWLVCIAVLALWIATQRPWSGLLLGPVSSWRLLLGCAAAAICLLPAFGMRSRAFKAMALRGPGKVAVGSLEPMVPHTARERELWTLVSVTAGICEEVLIRGFLLAFIAHFTGIVWAVPVSAIVFGLGHAYQGKQHIITTGIWGFTAALIAVAAGSLWPVIVLHIVQDLLMGDLGYRIISARSEYAAA